MQKTSFQMSKGTALMSEVPHFLSKQMEAKTRVAELKDIRWGGP
jgi:hypothetical protein